MSTRSLVRLRADLFRSAGAGSYDIYQRLAAAGVRFNSPRQNLRPGVWATYLKDHDGNTFELVQYDKQGATPMKLSGKKAVITGVGGGLGSAMARGLAREGADMAV